MGAIAKLFKWILGFSTIYCIYSLIDDYKSFGFDEDTIIIGFIAFFCFLFALFFSDVQKNEYEKECIMNNRQRFRNQYMEYKKSYIKIDTVNRKLLMKTRFYGNFVERSYSFDTVLGWSYSFEDHMPQILNERYVGSWAGQLGNGLGTGMANAILSAGALKKSKENTAIYINVKDIQYPVWKIQFPYHKKLSEFELRKWMELLNLTINESN